MKGNPDTLQEQVDDCVDTQSKDALRLMLNIQMEMLKTQERMLKKWSSIEFWIGVIGLVTLVSFILALMNH